LKHKPTPNETKYAFPCSPAENRATNLLLHTDSSLYMLKDNFLEYLGKETVGCHLSSRQAFDHFSYPTNLSTTL